ncbi:S8 family serine peptidase [Aurantiacibacter sediminis]|uniref:S8 family serine peptidase n=1 Tax=Aurantiacibacter sediminis TaxID=2793064 RepID=A0ABS0N4M8_9SPHN|nr:S8 family serine peptidase [Aurantiacibacter sediminis]MBH5322451.1 S8 family serine peptidase [Aurantiacibacter sediminis]
MRPHIVIRLRPDAVPHGRVPYWENAIGDRSVGDISLGESLSRTFAEHDVDVLVTREYPSSDGGWSAAEKAAALDRIFRLVLHRSNAIPKGLLRDIRLLPEVEEARPGEVVATELPQARAMSRPGQSRSHERISLDRAHQLTRGDPDLIVAVLDTGVDIGHPEFGGRFVAPKDFVDILSGAEEFFGDVLGIDDDPADDVGHGTHVAGIIGARGNGMDRGAAPACKIMPVRVLAAMEQGDHRVGAGLVDNINAGVKYAVDNGARVINMSLGVRHSGGGLPHREVVEYAHAKGATIVAAAGNDGREELYYPSALPGVIAVGAAGQRERAAGFSTFGRHVTLVAPGEDIYSTLPDGRYGMASGTSHAAPFVAAVAALVQSLASRAGGFFTPQKVHSILAHTADRFGRANRDRRAGYGMLNAADALRLAQLEIGEGTLR